MWTPDGVSTGVDEKTFEIISASDDGDRGVYVMDDGAIVNSAGIKKKKCTPFFHMANYFQNPSMKIPNSKFHFASPLP